MRSRCQMRLSNGLSRARACRHPARAGGVAVQVDGAAPARDGRRDQFAAREQRRDRRAGALQRYPRVVPQAQLAGDAVGAGGVPDELDHRLLLRQRIGARRTPCQHVRRQHRVQGDVPTLELRGAARGGEFAGPEQMLQRGLDQRPVPPPVAAVTDLVVRQGRLGLAGGQRAPLGDDLGDRLHQLGMFAGDAAHAAPRLLAGPAHPEAVAGPGVQRHEGRLVRPVLDQMAPAGIVAQGVQQGGVVRTEAGVKRQVVRARHGVDAVELHDAQPVGDGSQVRCSHLAAGAEAGAEALGCQRDPTGLGG